MHSYFHIVSTVFDFTRPLGVFHQKKIVFRLPSIVDTIYGNVLGERALRVTVSAIAGMEFIYFRKDLEYAILRRFFMLDVRFFFKKS